MFVGTSALIQKPETFQERFEKEKSRCENFIDRQIAEGKIFNFNIDGTKRSLTKEEIEECKEHQYKKIAYILSKTDSYMEELQKQFTDFTDAAFTTGAIYHKNPDGSRRLLNIEERLLFKANYFDALQPVFSDMTVIEDARNFMEASDKALIESEVLALEIREDRAELKKWEEIAARHFAEEEKLKIESEQHKAQATQFFIESAKMEKELIITSFYTIFNKTTNPLPEERYDDFFDLYLADRSISFENVPGEKDLKLNSMASVIKYLSDHPQTRTCNFSGFNSEVYDIPTFADFLMTPTGFTITAVAFRETISEEAKDVLANAVATRAQTSHPLKVQYLRLKV
ncbi:MAG: hypothetical protein ACH350_09940 [Parachlamydiaceae bacterium]